MVLGCTQHGIGPRPTDGPRAEPADECGVFSRWRKAQVPCFGPTKLSALKHRPDLTAGCPLGVHWVPPENGHFRQAPQSTPAPGTETPAFQSLLSSASRALLGLGGCPGAAGCSSALRAPRLQSAPAPALSTVCPVALMVALGPGAGVRVAAPLSLQSGPQGPNRTSVVRVQKGCQLRPHASSDSPSALPSPDRG